MAIRDRGTAAFFHGRHDELRDFHSLLQDARAADGGGTFLIQGAPGVGKTALLNECGKHAEAEGWRVAYVSAFAMHDPGELAKYLDLPYAASITEHPEGGIEGGVLTGRTSNGHGIQGQSVTIRGPAVAELIRGAAFPLGLVLILDEAQNLAKERQRGGDVEPAISGILDRIHNGLMGLPVVLLAGGLGTTRGVFAGFGVSRFAGKNVHQLGSLDRKSTESIVKDWLVHAGRASLESPHLAHWIEVLSDESFGWPQHIHTYAQTAAQWLFENDGEMTMRSLEYILDQARGERTQFYEGRAYGFEQPHRTAFANLLQEKGKHAILEAEQVISALESNLVRDKAERMYNDLVLKGVIAETPDGTYRVPIPSMHDWFVGRYANHSQVLPSVPPQAHASTGSTAEHRSESRAR